MLNHEQIQDIVGKLNFPGLNFLYLPFQNDPSLAYLQVVQRISGVPMKGRKWYISPHMTESEIVQTAFLAVKTWLEHEAREMFTYKGQKVFNPHFSVGKLGELAANEEFDVR